MADLDPVQFAAGSTTSVRGEATGTGPAVVCCHGITATRRYVLHGSRMLPRKGHRVITYDARGHGESDPAADGEGYGYPRLVDDLRAVADQEAGGRPFVLAGHSMGAHAAVAFALAHPGRLAGLVIIGPVYVGLVPEDTLAYWDGLADALEEGGTEGFVAYIDAGGIDPAWRDTLLRITRERIGLHRHPGALVEALREVPRSSPFETMGELEFLDVPALVVASHDEADPGHPRAVAEEYAARIPGARLVGEEPGGSPLAWQGGKLSREIATFCAEPAVAARLGSEPNGAPQ